MGEVQVGAVEVEEAEEGLGAFPVLVGFFHHWQNCRVFLTLGHHAPVRTFREVAAFRSAHAPQVEVFCQSDQAELVSFQRDPSAAWSQTEVDHTDPRMESNPLDVVGSNHLSTHASVHGDLALAVAHNSDPQAT